MNVVIACFQSVAVTILWLLTLQVSVAAAEPHRSPAGEDQPYLPRPESEGGWRKLNSPADVRRLGIADFSKRGDGRIRTDE